MAFLWWFAGRNFLCSIRFVDHVPAVAMIWLFQWDILSYGLTCSSLSIPHVVFFPHTPTRFRNHYLMITGVRNTFRAAKDWKRTWSLYLAFVGERESLATTSVETKVVRVLLMSSIIFRASFVHPALCFMLWMLDVASGVFIRSRPCVQSSEITANKNQQPTNECFRSWLKIEQECWLVGYLLNDDS